MWANIDLEKKCQYAVAVNIITKINFLNHCNQLNLGLE